MGAPPTQYPLGQNQNPGAYAAQGWGAAAAYQQQWPGQQNDPCKFFSRLLSLWDGLKIVIYFFSCSQN